jgi:hypothetical protein
MSMRLRRILSEFSFSFFENFRKFRMVSLKNYISKDLFKDF